DSQLKTLGDSMLADQANYNLWWDSTNGTTQTTYVDPAKVFNTLKIDTQSTNSITMSRDGSQNIQDNTVTYKYGRKRLPKGTPLSSSLIYNAANDGALLLGAYGKGSFIQDDGNGNLTVGSTEQRYTVTRGQRAQLGE